MQRRRNPIKESDEKAKHRVDILKTLGPLWNKGKNKGILEY
jgi:hypothetical protein